MKKAEQKMRNTENTNKAVMIEPSKPVDEMSDEEIDGFVDELLDALLGKEEDE